MSKEVLRYSFYRQRQRDDKLSAAYLPDSMAMLSLEAFTVFF
jgi:hypothetical protein